MSILGIAMGIVGVIVGFAKFMESNGTKMYDNIEKDFHSKVKKDPVSARNNWAGQMLFFIVVVAGVLALLIMKNF